LTSRATGTFAFGDGRYKVSDLSAAKEFYSKAFGLTTYFDEPTWVVFQIHDYPLWLEPDNLTGESVYEATDHFYKPSEPVKLTFWSVKDVQAICNRFKELGGTLYKSPNRNGPFIYAIVEDPWGNKLGLLSKLFKDHSDM